MAVSKNSEQRCATGSEGSTQDKQWKLWGHGVEENTQGHDLPSEEENKPLTPMEIASELAWARGAEAAGSGKGPENADARSFGYEWRRMEAEPGPYRVPSRPPCEIAPKPLDTLRPASGGKKRFDVTLLDMGFVPLATRGPGEARRRRGKRAEER